MKVRYIGQQGDPDFITQYGFKFERKGEHVVVPDDHKMAHKFVNNPFFDATGDAVEGLTVEPTEQDGDLDVIEPPSVPARGKKG